MTGIVDWPEYALPAPPLNDGYQVTLPNTGERTDFEQGPPRQINVFRSGATQYAIQWPMTPAQFEIYKGIKRHVLNDGTSWFKMRVFDGLDYVTRTVRFVVQPDEPKRSGGDWIVSVVVETLDDVAPSADDTAEMLLTYGSGLSADDVADMFHIAIHVNLRQAFTP